MVDSKALVNILMTEIRDRIILLLIIKDPTFLTNLGQIIA